MLWQSLLPCEVFTGQFYDTRSSKMYYAIFSFFNIPIFLQELSGRSKTKRRQKISQKSKQPRQSGEPCYHRVSALNEANYLPKSVQNMHLHVEAKERQPAEQNIELNSLSLSLSLSRERRSILEWVVVSRRGTRERFRETSHGITKDTSVLRITYSLSIYIYIYI